jgi:hypothetical protein
MYTQFLKTHPILTKSTTAMLILGTGDVFTQVAIEQVKHIDQIRALKFAAIGGILVGPTLHFWYTKLAQTGYSVPKRVAIDQFLFAPSFLSVFIGTVGLLNNKDPVQEIRRTIGETMVANWTIWIPYQFFVFNYIPIQYQVLANNTMGVAWNTFLSWNLNRK